MIVLITILQIVVCILVRSNIDDCNRYKINDYYSTGINVVDNIKRKSDILSKLNTVIMLLLGILWGFIIMK